MNAEKTVSVLVTMLTSDGDGDVRAATAQALSVFGAQGLSLYPGKFIFVLTSLLRNIPEGVEIGEGYSQVS